MHPRRYYGHFYKTQLRPTLKRIDAYVIRCARASMATAEYREP
jgi:hypothetical protein